MSRDPRRKPKTKVTARGALSASPFFLGGGGERQLPEGPCWHWLCPESHICLCACPDTEPGLAVEDGCCCRGTRRWEAAAAAAAAAAVGMLVPAQPTQGVSNQTETCALCDTGRASGVVVPLQFTVSAVKRPCSQNRCRGAANPVWGMQNPNGGASLLAQVWA